MIPSTEIQASDQSAISLHDGESSVDDAPARLQNLSASEARQTSVISTFLLMHMALANDTKESYHPTWLNRERV
jgi:hypothetical protein